MYLHKSPNSLLINLSLSHHTIHYLFQSANLLPIQVPVSQMINIAGERERKEEEEKKKKIHNENGGYCWLVGIVQAVT